MISEKKHQSALSGLVWGKPHSVGINNVQEFVIKSTI